MTKDKIIQEVYDMNLQNLTEKTSFDRAYKQGIIDTIDELIELKLLIIPNVVKSFTAEEVVNELKENETLDDAISFYNNQK